MADKLGEGYDAQRRYLEFSHQKQQRNQKDFIQNVGSPQKEKLQNLNEQAGANEALRGIRIEAAHNYMQN